MNKLRILLVAAAFLTAACGAATVSGSAVKSVSNSGNVRVDAGANAGTDVAASPADPDPGPVNPTVHKGATAPVQQSVQPATIGAQPATSGADRCSSAFGANTGSTAAAAGKHPPLPECAVE